MPLILKLHAYIRACDQFYLVIKCHLSVEK